MNSITNLDVIGLSSEIAWLNRRSSLWNWVNCLERGALRYAIFNLRTIPFERKHSASGQRIGYIPVRIVDDLLDENVETIIVRLRDPVGALLAALQAIYTISIRDDDATPQIQFQLSSSSWDEASGTARIVATLSAPSGRTVSVSYRVSSRTARNGSDFRLTGGRLVFETGEVQKTIHASIIDDVLDELDEDFVISLLKPAKATLGNNATHRVTIEDNDSPATNVTRFIDFQLPNRQIDQLVKRQMYLFQSQRR
jgi:hypothetical protein